MPAAAEARLRPSGSCSKVIWSELKAVRATLRGTGERDLVVNKVRLASDRALGLLRHDSGSRLSDRLALHCNSGKMFLG